MSLFKKAKEVAKSVEEEVVTAMLPKTEEPEKPVEEWVWVDGFKGTDKDMKCRDYQFELDKRYDISDDIEVALCEHGFHLCLNVKDVHEYYPVGINNRFFEVKALVRKSDLETYGKTAWTGHWIGRVDKLVAKSIIFERELSVDEILQPYGTDEWSDEDKKLVLECGVENIRRLQNKRSLIEMGYSEPFANIIIEKDKFGIAKAVGTQEGLSMDMKVWTIFNV